MLPIAESSSREFGSGGPRRRDALHRRAGGWRALSAVRDRVERRAAKNLSVRSLRPLDIRCGPRRHRVAVVYEVPDYGPVLVANVASMEPTDEWTTTTVVDTDPDGRDWEVEARQRVERFMPRGAGDLAILLDPTARGSDERFLEVQCRCRTTDLDLDQVAEWIRAGRAQVRLR